MKETTKKWIERGVIWFAPVFTILMYLIRGIATDNHYFERNTYVGDTISQKHTYFELLKIDIGVYPKIIMWVSLVGVASSLIIYLVGYLLKDKEPLFTKIGAITLVASSALLIATSFAKSFEKENGALIAHRWVEFLTPLYGLLIVYNVATLIYTYKKFAIKDNK